MAAIDKIYADIFEKYNIFKEWCRYQPTIKDKYGKKLHINDFLLKGDKDGFKSIL